MDQLRLSAAGLLTQGVPGVLQDPLAPRRGPLGPSPYRESASVNALALVPGPLAGLQDLQLLTELSPQVGGRLGLLAARGGVPPRRQRSHRGLGHACRVLIAAHQLYTIFAYIFGASVPEAATRPTPR